MILWSAFSVRAGGIGDAAPALKVAEWIQGKSVDLNDGKNIHVVIFCSLTRANDFALSKIKEIDGKYRSKGIITVVVCDEPPQGLKETVKAKASKIEYPVAADDVRRTTTEYVRVFGNAVLPRAFVISKDGKVLWHGHPMGGLEGILDQIISGKFDLERTRKEMNDRALLENYIAMARQNEKQGAAAGKVVLTQFTNDAFNLCELSFKIATDPMLEKRDAALANAALERAEQISTTNTTRIAVIRAILKFQTGEMEAGLTMARQALSTAKTAEDKDLAKANLLAMERLAAMSKVQTNSPETKK